MVIINFIFDRKKVASRNKEGLIELYIYLDGKKKYISTGIKVYPVEWRNGQVIGRVDWQQLNKRLQVIYNNCMDVVTRMMEEGNFDLQAVPKLLNESFVVDQTFLEYAKSVANEKFKRLAPGTRKRYEVFFKFFEKWGKIKSFHDLTEKNVLAMDEVLRKKGLQACSIYTYHKILKVFISQAIEEGLIKKSPYSRIDIARGENTGIDKYLTPEEFHRFEKAKIDVPHLNKVRDLFVFQTYTMMSYSDLEAFDYKKCVQMKGKVIYKATRIKTKQPFTIVIMPQAMDILKKYNNKLPIIANQKYNDYLKSAVGYARIRKPVTTHWARHTGATMLLNELGVPIHIIQHILGHASIRETERTYAKLMDETIVDTMANYV